MKKLEEYVFNKDDAKRYEIEIAFIISKMLKVIAGEMLPVCSPSDACASCGFAYSCDAVKNEAFTPAALVNKLKVLDAAKKQVEGALRKIADKGSFFVGDEEWGYQISDNYRLPHKIKKHQIPNLLALHNPQLLRDKSSVSIDSEVKNFLEGLGIKGIHNQPRKTLVQINESTLKIKKGDMKRSETTLASLAKSA